MEDDSNIEAVEKALGNPVFISSDDRTEKLKSRLIISSFGGLAIVLGELSVESRPAFFGLEFEGLTSRFAAVALLAIIVYLLLHYVWAIYDQFLEWRIRLTGTRVAFITAGVFASEHGDYPNDPRQSTLYNWWKAQIRNLDGLQKILGRVEVRLNDVENEVERIEQRIETPSGVSNVMQSIQSLEGEFVKLRGVIEKYETTLQATRIPASLGRFDSWFRRFLRSQNLRWLLTELVMPCALGLVALGLLVADVSCR